MVNLRRFNLVTLALVVAVVRARSISGGANALNLAVAAASKRLTDFENEIGCTIFHRRPSGIEMTAAGQAIYHEILSVVENVDRLAGAVADLASDLPGQIRLWANPVALNHYLPDDLSSFVRRHPAIRIELEERNSREIIPALSDNRADIGIFFADTIATAGVETFHYRKERLVIVVPRHHALGARRTITFEQALQHDFIGLLPKTPLARRLEQENVRLGRSPNVRILARSVEAMCRMISVDLGIGIMSEASARTYLRPLQLRSIKISSDAWGARNLVIGVRDVGALQSATRLLLAHLRGPRRKIRAARLPR